MVYCARPNLLACFFIPVEIYFSCSLFYLRSERLPKMACRMR